MSDGGHTYTTVGGRRWCKACNTYQVYNGDGWRDGFPPELWPGYEATQPTCPGATGPADSLPLFSLPTARPSAP